MDGPELEKALGKADWIWDEELGVHVPCCAVRVGYYEGRTCGNGPLIGDAVRTGDCGEHGTSDT